MTDSIFETIKSMLGSDSDYTVFDNDICMFTNSAIATLTQIGIGPKEGFKITPEGAEKWNDFLGDRNDLESVKEYIYMKVRIAFDPPSNSSVLSSYKEACKELEWRLNVASEEPK